MLLVVGAGASYAEGIVAGLAADDTPPLLKRFVKTLWLTPQVLHPGPAVTSFLDHLQLPYSRIDQIDILAQIEDDPERNVERLFAHAYQHRDDPHPMWQRGMISPYQNLLFRGLMWPLSNLLRRGLLVKGEDSNLPLHNMVARLLQPGMGVLQPGKVLSRHGGLRKGRSVR